MTDPKDQAPRPEEELPPPPWHVPLRILAYAAVAVSLLLANAGLAWAAAIVAGLTWAVGSRLLLGPDRTQVAFADRFVVTLAIILAAIQLMGILLGGGIGLSPWVGEPAPNFQVTTLDGETIRLSDLEGRRVMLYFWATWCGPCRAMTPNLAALAQEMGDEELTIIGISNESPDVLAQYVEAASIPFPIVSAPTLPKPYSEVTRIPTLVVIDRNGIIQNIVSGARGLDALRDYATQRDWTRPRPAQ